MNFSVVKSSWGGKRGCFWVILSVAAAFSLGFFLYPFMLFFKIYLMLMLNGRFFYKVFSFKIG